MNVRQGISLKNFIDKIVTQDIFMWCYDLMSLSFDLVMEILNDIILQYYQKFDGYIRKSN